MSDLPRDDGGWRVLPQDYLAQRPATYASSRQPRLVLRGDARRRAAGGRCLPAVGFRGRCAPSVCRRSSSSRPTIGGSRCAATHRRRRSRASAPAATATSSCRAAMRWSSWTCAAPARRSASAKAFARRRSATIIARSSTGSSRSVVERCGGRNRHLLCRCRGRFLASTGHPAVKAIAPLFSVWDTYSDHYYPGGMLLNRLAETYDELMIALDHGRGELLATDHELSGHPCVTLHLSASEADAALHVYLEDVAPDGTCRYVTEGMLRALHRKECPAPHASPGRRAVPLVHPR